MSPNEFSWLLVHGWQAIGWIAFATIAYMAAITAIANFTQWFDRRFLETIWGISGMGIVAILVFLFLIGLEHGFEPCAIGIVFTLFILLPGMFLMAEIGPPKLKCQNSTGSAPGNNPMKCDEEDLPQIGEESGGAASNADVPPWTTGMSDCIPEESADRYRRYKDRILSGAPI